MKSDVGRVFLLVPLGRETQPAMQHYCVSAMGDQRLALNKMQAQMLTKDPLLWALIAMQRGSLLTR